MKKTKILKSLVIALTFLFTMALTFGITVAAYNTSRTADGTLTMDNGIVINYTGFGKVQDGEWENEQTTTFKLFANRDILPGDTINLNPAAIQKGSNSVDYYVRIKFEYKFYDALNADITSQIADYSAFLSTPAFASAWVDGNNNDGWFYYATGTTLNALPTSYVNIFDGAQSINVALNADGFNHQGGGYKYSEQITITKIEATLTLEALQTTGSTWEINPLVQNSNSQVVEIYSNQITLGNVGGAYKLGTGEAGSLAYNTANLGTTLKIVVAGDSQINANAFANNTQLENIYIGDADYISGVSSYSAKIYTTPATFTIGTNAFAGCSNLDIYLSSSVNYNIYASSLEGARNVYYDGVLNNSLKSPSVGAVAGTTITVLANPSIVTGGTGVGAVNTSNNLSYGAYTYEDTFGNIWYFDLGHYNDLAGEEHFEITSLSQATQARIRYCELHDSSSNQTLTIPSNVYKNSEETSIPVTSLEYGFVTSNNLLISSIDIPSLIYDIEGSLVGFNNLSSFIGGNSNIIISSDNRSLMMKKMLYYDNEGFSADHTFHEFVIMKGIAPYGCSEYSIPNLVDIIDFRVFFGITNLTSITIPNSVKRIGDRVFEHCTGLTSITIPNSVLQIGGSAFYGCTSLTTAVINVDITSVQSWCFSGCSNLTNVTLPVSVTSIGNGAFSGCNKLTGISWKASYNLGNEMNNEIVELSVKTPGLTIGELKLPEQSDLISAGITPPTGKAILGWTDGENTYIDVASISAIRSGLTAIWADACTLTYNLSSYTGEATEISVVYGKGRNISIDFDIIPIVKNQRFLGWDADPTSLNPTYTESGTNNITLNTNVTLYAIWESCVQYTVTLANVSVNSEGEDTLIGEGWMMVNNKWIKYVDENASLTLPTSYVCFTNDSSFWVGWYSLTEDSGELSNPITVTEDLNLYAREMIV